MSGDQEAPRIEDVLREMNNILKSDPEIDKTMQQRRAEAFSASLEYKQLSQREICDEITALLYQYPKVLAEQAHRFGMLVNLLKEHLKHVRWDDGPRRN